MHDPKGLKIPIQGFLAGIQIYNLNEFWIKIEKFAKNCNIFLDSPKMLKGLGFSGRELPSDWVRIPLKAVHLSLSYDQMPPIDVFEVIGLPTYVLNQL